jgi:hypothetical protein
MEKAYLLRIEMHLLHSARGMKNGGEREMVSAAQQFAPVKLIDRMYRI